MLQSLIGTKQKMIQSYVDNTRVPVTVVKAGPCTVTQVKNMTTDGYWAVQLGFGEKRLKNTSKSLQGHLKLIIKDNKAPRHLAEIRFMEDPQMKVGDKVNVSDVFFAGDVVEVTGISKGKGFAGAVKRWHFRGGPKTHGQSDRHRAPGSIGQGTTPGRVLKGKHMAGRMGSDQVTIKNLSIVAVDPENQEIHIKGQVPGTRNSFVKVSILKAAERPETPQETTEIVEAVTPEVESKTQEGETNE